MELNTAKYQIFNSIISSEIEFPELAPGDGGAEWRVRMARPGEQPGQEFEPRFRWLTATGEESCRCARRDGDYLFVFENIARFLIRRDRTIVCFREPGCELSMLRHLVLNQVIPRCLASTGHLVLHASAVCFPDGRCAAFLGNSGYGKSTLAASFLETGARVLSDDCILLSAGKEGVTATGGMAGMRLYPDSLRAVFKGGAAFEPYTSRTAKQQMLLTSHAGAGAGRAVLLDALFVLNDPRSAPVSGIEVERTGGARLMMALLNGVFCLDPTERHSMSDNFTNLGAVINGALPAWSLSFPRQHSGLPAVHEAVMGCLRQVDGRPRSGSAG